MKSNGWALAVFALITFGAITFIGSLTIVDLFSLAFGGSIDCWLDPNNGTWLSPNEANMIGMMVFGVISIVASLIAWAVLDKKKLINNRTAGRLVILSIVSGGVVYFANAATNDEYINRLYEACGRQN